MMEDKLYKHLIMQFNVVNLKNKRLKFIKRGKLHYKILLLME
jgi:hypothetical protein